VNLKTPNEFKNTDEALLPKTNKLPLKKKNSAVAYFRSAQEALTVAYFRSAQGRAA
jgi:hypothetical protein